MKRFTTKRRWLLLGVVTVVAGMAAFGAYAYWTASGTGSGTATVGTDNGVTIAVTDTGSALYPGGSATVTFHVHNDSGSSSVMVGKVVQDWTGHRSSRRLCGGGLLVRGRHAERVRAGLRERREPHRHALDGEHGREPGRVQEREPGSPSEDGQLGPLGGFERRRGEAARPSGTSRTSREETSGVMNPGELISRERLAVAVLVLLLLAGVLGVGLLHGWGAGSPAAPEVVPGLQPPSPSPASPSESPGPGRSSNGSGGGTSSDPVTPSAGNPHGTPSGGAQGSVAPSPGGTGQPTPPPAPVSPHSPPSPPPAGKPANLPFQVSGDVSGLAPGASTVIVLTLRNPNSVRIRVTRVTVAVSADSSPSGCSSTTNLVLHQATGISPGSPVTIPARGSVTLSTFPRAPRLGFRELRTNQDACRGKSFRLTYTGSAHS